MTKLGSSAQGIFKVSLYLFFILRQDSTQAQEQVSRGKGIIGKHLFLSFLVHLFCAIIIRLTENLFMV